MTQQWYQSLFDEGTTEAAGPFAQTPATTIKPIKSFRLKGEHDKLMDSHLRGNVVVYKFLKLGSVIDSAEVLGQWVNGRTTESLFEPHD
ncbi:hypothetical protein MTR_8g071940 [Medicago truncatula]|uniref:Uncharacterized protein n=1 Tax=Medicago truncatula TaxID=3880 RepID=G7L749_MEDTR|nr:hypothetical protein MTR_8g071940 [Medicago truncatula]